MSYFGPFFGPYFGPSAPSSGGGRRYRQYPIPIIPDDPEPDDAFIIAMTL